ncbi:DUF5133 domain-containing protein [Actinacidiphila soli]|jgi:hypothetical protein|uniref:DUF5133 domain-containing protein n=1 Tax=Actinacidiphila soli TaxID=2487275 RepID=UPI000FCA16CC|nr:DUF5133 domain-containing protein [Actinacidiphila soli]
MPLIDFRALRELVAEFDRLSAVAAPRAVSKAIRRRVEDVQYTVCVYTGLRDPHAAMSRARRLLRDRTGSAKT